MRTSADRIWTYVAISFAAIAPTFSVQGQPASHADNLAPTSPRPAAQAREVVLDLAHARRDEFVLALQEELSSRAMVLVGSDTDSQWGALVVRIAEGHSLLWLTPQGRPARFAPLPERLDTLDPASFAVIAASLIDEVDSLEPIDLPPVLDETNVPPVPTTNSQQWRTSTALEAPAEAGSSNDYLPRDGFYLTVGAGVSLAAGVESHIGLHVTQRVRAFVALQAGILLDQEEPVFSAALGGTYLALDGLFRLEVGGLLGALIVSHVDTPPFFGSDSRNLIAGWSIAAMANLAWQVNEGLALGLRTSLGIAQTERSAVFPLPAATAYVELPI